MKFIVNYLEASYSSPNHTKTIIFTFLDLLVSLANFSIEIFIMMMTLMKTDFYPIFIIASLFDSALAIVRNFLTLIQSTSMASKLSRLPERTAEQLEAEEKDTTCTVCQH